MNRASCASRPGGCREIADSGIGGPAGAIYPGTCHRGLAPGRQPRALRVKVDGPAVAFEDRVQGRLSHCLERESGDFVVHRADGLFAYQLAVVVDDAEQAITEAVRGADLLDSTPRQIHLQRLLGLPTPQYLHLPVAVDARGKAVQADPRGAPGRRPAGAPAERGAGLPRAAAPGRACRGRGGRVLVLGRGALAACAHPAGAGAGGALRGCGATVANSRSAMRHIQWMSEE